MISDSNVGSLNRIEQLEELVLTRNKIKSISAIKLNGLKILKLNENEIETPGFLCDGLEMLDLSQNRIEDIFENSFIHLKKLMVLDLEANGLKYLTKGTFKGLNELNLKSNKLVDVEPDAFEDLSNLKFLNLSSNRIVTVHFLSLIVCQV